jgi:phytoene synthase
MNAQLKYKEQLFRNGSTTYFYSSLFFPKKIWEKVTTLYAYVRVADNFVDANPQQIQDFADFVDDTRRVICMYQVAQKKTGKWQYGTALFKNSYLKTQHGEIIQPFISLLFEHSVPLSWLTAFLTSMATDIAQSGSWIRYKTSAEYKKYVYGSAEVIGLVMCKLLGLPQKAYDAARQQGAAMQHINFIRDLQEDCELKRVYFPEETLQKYGITSFCDPVLLGSKKSQFQAFIDQEIATFEATQKQAREGYGYIPYWYRVPIATAAQLYLWTARVIKNNPKIVFEKKVKPSKYRVFLTICSVGFRELFRKQK